MSTIEFVNIGDMLHNTSNEDLYSDHFENESESFNNPLIIEIEDVYNKIVSDVPNITGDQEFVLRHIFNQFRYVQKAIDPNRLKRISVTITEDDDIVLYRNTETDLINLIIHPEDDFTLSIINKSSGNSIEYFDIKDVDFEKIVYDFLK